jgi:hypothetical protein
MAQAPQERAREDVMAPSFRDGRKTGPGIHNPSVKGETLV